MPHDEQNFEPAGFDAWHDGQLTVGGASEPPHDEQNFEPAGFDVRQEGQLTAAGAGCWVA